MRTCHLKTISRFEIARNFTTQAHVHDHIHRPTFAAVLSSFLSCVSHVRVMASTATDVMISESELQVCATILARSGRPKLLAQLKDMGISKLSERQALANRISRQLKSGEVMPSTEDDPDELPSARLLRAVSDGDEIKVNTLLNNPSPPADILSRTDAKGNNALMLASSHGHDSTLHCLLGHLTRCSCDHADILEQRRPDDGLTAALLATKHGRHGCLRLLLNAKADADAINADGWSALMMACEGDDAEAVRVLLNIGHAIPVAGLHNGYAVVLTPLKLACVNGHAACARLLLEANAHLGDDDGTKCDVVEADGSTMLIYATQRTKRRAPKPFDGHAETVRLLLEHSAMPDQTRWDGLTSLAYACMYGDATTAMYLLGAGASASKADEAGWTPLIWAALHGHVACASLLLDSGAAPHEARPNGCTALMAACLGGSEACVTALLGAKADCEARMDSGTRCTALMLAAAHGHAPCVRVLLAAGASPSTEDAIGRRAFDYVDGESRGAIQHQLLCADSGFETAAAMASGDSVSGDSVGIHSSGTASSPATSAFAFDSTFVVRFRRIDSMSNLDSWQELVKRHPTWHETHKEVDAALNENPSLKASPLHPMSAPAPTPTPLPPHFGGGPGSGPLLRYCCSSTHPHFANLLQLILLSHGFERIAYTDDDSRWSLVWYAGQINPEALRRLQPHQLCSKFPHSSCLTTKSQLWRTFERMQRRHGEEAFGFIAPSFILPEQADELASKMRRDAAQRPDDAIWIVKPVASCRGQGITLHRSVDGPLQPEMAARRSIASRYIHPPYLVAGRKVDLRLYVLVTSWRPLCVYLHACGLARLASTAYSLSDLGDSSTHLTNYSINKHVERGDCERGGNERGIGGDRISSTLPKGPKLSLKEFREILERDVGMARAEMAWGDVDAAIAKCIIAAEPTMGSAMQTYVPSNGCGCFQLLGFDVILDASLVPWVLEVNLDPSLATDSRLDLDVKAAVLTDLLNLVDAGNPRRKHVSAAVAAGDDAEVVSLVDAELNRARLGGWRRLHPSKRSVEYAQFFDPSRAALNALHFCCEP